MLALYDRDPLTGCTVPWDASYEMLGVHRLVPRRLQPLAYDLQGACFEGPCVVGLNRLEINEDTDGTSSSTRTTAARARSAPHGAVRSVRQ